MSYKIVFLVSLLAISAYANPTCRIQLDRGTLTATSNKWLFSSAKGPTGFYFDGFLKPPYPTKEFSIQTEETDCLKTLNCQNSKALAQRIRVTGRLQLLDVLLNIKLSQEEQLYLLTIQLNSPLNNDQDSETIRLTESDIQCLQNLD